MVWLFAPKREGSGDLKRIIISTGPYRNSQVGTLSVPVPYGTVKADFLGVDLKIGVARREYIYFFNIFSRRNSLNISSFNGYLAYMSVSGHAPFFLYYYFAFSRVGL